LVVNSSLASQMPLTIILAGKPWQIPTELPNPPNISPLNFNTVFSIWWEVQYIDNWASLVKTNSFIWNLLWLTWKPQPQLWYITYMYTTLYYLYTMRGTSDLYLKCGLLWYKCSIIKSEHSTVESPLFEHQCFSHILRNRVITI